MVKLRIDVTKEILTKAQYCGKKIARSTGENCAIALAVRDIFPEAFVSHENIYPFAPEDGKRDYKSRIDLPLEAQDFIVDFDNAEPEERCQMDPISFEIEVPDVTLEKINISEITKQLESHPYLTLITQ